jgi:hypothetical protein
VDRQLKNRAALIIERAEADGLLGVAWTTKELMDEVQRLEEENERLRQEVQELNHTADLQHRQ